MILSLMFASLCIAFSMTLLRPPSRHPGPGLSDDAFRAALEAQDRLGRS
jgi:hypothetical protein